MTAIAKTMIGVAAPELYVQKAAEKIRQMPADAIMLLPGTHDVSSLFNIAAIFKENMQKEVYMPLCVDGFDRYQMMTIREQAREAGVAGLFLSGNNVARAAEVLRNNSLILGCSVPVPFGVVPRENAFRLLLDRINAGCSSLLIAPWIGEKAIEFLSDFAKASGQELPPVLYGIMPVELKAEVKHLQDVVPDYLKKALSQAADGEVAAFTIDAEVRGYEKASKAVQGVYANCTHLESDASLALFMERLSIATGKQ